MCNTKKLIFALILSFFSVPHDSKAQDFNDYRRNVLAHRIDRFLVARLWGLSKCSKDNPGAETIAEEAKMLRSNFITSRTPSVENTLQLMEAFSIIEKFKTTLQPNQELCKMWLDQSDQIVIKNDRSKFKWAYAFSSTKQNALLQELDPRCDLQSPADYGSKIPDPNNCTAGYYLIIRAMASDGPHNYDKSAYLADEWIQNLTLAIQNYQPGTSIDIAAISGIDQSNSYGRHLTMTLFAFFSDSAGSNLGMSTPIDDEIWQSSLKSGHSSIETYNSFFRWKNRKDSFRIQFRKSKKRGIEFKFAGESIQTWNHHEVISAFLSCDYFLKGYHKIAYTLPEALGIVYETKDFASHIHEGMSFKDSVENFKTDTKRHEIGAQFGVQYCK